MSPATAARLTRWWARLYTMGLPREQRDRRLAEIDSDLWESLAERACAREIVERTARGAFDDLIWSNEQMERTARESLWWSVGSLLALSSVVLWMAFTPDGQGMRSSMWAWPIALILHNLGFVALIGLRTAVDLRLTTRVLGTVRVRDLTRKLMPATVAAAVLVIGSGLALFLPAPGALLANGMFRLKLAVLAIALANIWFLHAVTLRTAERWDTAAVPPVAARISGFLSLTLWAAIILLAVLTPFLPAGP